MSPSTLIGILEIAAASDGQIDTRIRLQKEAYLLSLVGDRWFDPLDFEYHHYGPYCRAVSDTLRHAVVMGYLEEHAHPYDEPSQGVRYSYRLTGAGERAAGGAGVPEESRAEIIRYLNKQHWRCLELAATARYLQEREGVADQDDAIEEAIKLKPATHPFRKQADELIKKYWSA